MATITFKAKPETIYNVDNSVAYQRIRVPVLTRNHCDMPAFRKHLKFGGLANSDLFPAVLKRVRDGLGDYLRLDRPLPENVTVDAGGFLHTVKVEV